MARHIAMRTDFLFKEGICEIVQHILVSGSCLFLSLFFNSFHFFGLGLAEVGQEMLVRSKFFSAVVL